MAVKNSIILDTSVVVKWFTPEEDKEKARSLLKDFYNDEIVIIFPALLFYELGNVLINKRISIGTVSEIMIKLQKLCSLGLVVEDIGLKWFKKIYQNSVEYSLTFYDAAYITLLQNKDGHFVTADTKLFQKVNKAFSNVKLLSEMKQLR